MDPGILLTVFQVVGAVAGAAGASSQKMTEAARLESEARLSETQAIQRDTASRDELTRFISSTQSARSANGLSAFSPNALAFFNEANTVMNRDRMVQSANYRQRAANMRLAAGSARKGASLSLLTGVAKGGVSLMQGRL